MSAPPTHTARSGPPRLPAAAVTLVVLVAAAALGPLAMAFVAGAVLVLAYLELRRLMSPERSPAAIALGAAAVAGSVWLGHRGRARDIVWALAALVILVFLVRLFEVELGRRSVSGVTTELAATVTSAGLAGVLGAHMALLRGLENYGFRGVASLILIGAAAAVFARRHPVIGIAVAAVAGIVAGVVFNPPLDAGRGAAFGTMVGILWVVGARAVAALETDAGVQIRFRHLGGLVDAAGGLLVATPVYFWAFRTLVL